MDADRPLFILHGWPSDASAQGDILTSLIVQVGVGTDSSPATRRREMLTAKVQVRHGWSKSNSKNCTDGQPAAVESTERPSARHRITHNSVELHLAYSSRSGTMGPLSVCLHRFKCQAAVSQGARAGAGTLRTNISLTECNSNTTPKFPICSS